MGLIGRSRRRSFRLPAVLGRDNGRPAIAVAMACLTFVAALLAALQSDAGTAAARAERAADSWAIERTGLDAASVAGGLRDITVFRQWFAVLEEAEWARTTGAAADPGTNGEGGADAATREALARIDADLAEWLRQQSPLLQPPYFDPATYLVDFNGYYGDQAAASLEATERTRVENLAADAWEAKAASYVTALTIVAVALFFLGLAGTVAVRARRILVIAGLGLSALAVAWTALLATQPVVPVPDAAIAAVVRSSVALQRAGSGEPTLLSEATTESYEAAIADAQRSVDLDPGYVTARRALGEASLFFANARIFAAEGPSEPALELVRSGIRSLEAAVEIDGTDPSLWWNLGFARYIAGDAAGAIAATREVIDRSPGEFVPYVNLAVAELAAGRRDEAIASIEQAIQVARASNMDTNGFFFGRVDANLARLATLRPAEADDLLAMQRRLREARVAMRALDGLPPPDAPEIDALEATGLDLRPDGTFAVLESVAGGTVAQDELSGLRLRIVGSPDLAGHHVSVRAWLNERADTGFDRDQVADAAELSIDLVDPYGRAGFELGAGQWLVEVFVDGHTRGSLSFEVVAPG